MSDLIGEGKYEGETQEGWFHGSGRYTYDNGVIYEGEFAKGRFHGKGVLIYPNGGRFSGEWENGRLIPESGKYEFADGLKFEDPKKWEFCTYKDRRFYHEHIHGVENPDIEKYATKLFREIPEGCYDTGDGYYVPEKGAIFTYDKKYLREPNEEEEEWIRLKCRYNPKQDEITEENQDKIEQEDTVIDNILREYKFVKYAKDQ